MSIRLPRLTIPLVVLGAMVAALWIWLIGGPEAILPGLNRVRMGFLPLLLGVTAFCLFVRFVRWQYLLRRVGIRLPARPTLSIFLASLIGIATPAYAGELLRSLLLRRRFGASIPVTAAVLVVERVYDLAALALIATLTSSAAWFQSLMVLLGAVSILAGLGVVRMVSTVGTIPGGFRELGAPATLLQGLLLSLLAWVPTCLLVFLAAASLNIQLSPLEGMRVFSTATIFGGLSLMPAGVGSVGSAAIVQIQALGVPLATSVLIVSLVRLTSTGFSLAVSGVFLIWEFRRARGTVTAPEHFDEIAPDYKQQFSPHMWDLLLDRRSRRLCKALERLPGAKAGIGLDLGSGLGQQAKALEERGYDVFGIDAAHGLVRHSTQSGVKAVTADLLSLPFPDSSMDFVYTIGVLHHLPGVRAQADAVREVARVLKPSGLFLVQETNPRNPLFRFYMGYVFPITRTIDEGTEWWIYPETWDEVPDMALRDLQYFSFLPDFAPRVLLKPLLAMEQRLQSSFFRSYSIHYMAVLQKRR